jgi:hypothetical protein
VELIREGREERMARIDPSYIPERPIHDDEA